MLRSNSHQQESYGRLYAVYQSEWQTFRNEIRRWQSLQAEGQTDVCNILQAEALAYSAQDRYRRARNQLSEYILEHASTESLVAG